MLDILLSAKRSKDSTSINTSGLCQTKENVLECVANWLSHMNHNYSIDNAAPPLLYGVFFKLAELIAEKDYTFSGLSKSKTGTILRKST
eukprot:9128722-Ditylum_brightwellii.AAC.1